MLGEERRSRLLEMVRNLQFASLPQLVDHLGVSESTIRRDLELLEEQGVDAAYSWRRAVRRIGGQSPAL